MKIYIPCSSIHLRKSLESGPSRDPEENLICILFVKLGLFKVVGMLVDEISKCPPQLRIPFDNLKLYNYDLYGC